MGAKEIVSAVKTGRALDAEAAFRDTMISKISDTLEKKRMEIAKDFVASTTETETDTEV
jgi:hypothetical protein